MACITFGVRYAFFIRRLPIQVGERFQHFLGFSAPAVLTALWIPIVLFPDGQLHADIKSPYLLAASLACVLGLLRMGTMKIIVLSMLCFWLLK